VLEELHCPLSFCLDLEVTFLFAVNLVVHYGITAALVSLGSFCCKAYKVFYCVSTRML